jgi:Sulfatase
VVAKPFRGVINVDVTQSVPDWEPYTQPIAPEGTPSVLYIVLDDVGYSAMGPYGGLIETPNIDRIAERGLTYTNFHTTALCSPTRSCLMTGRNHTTNGMATITEAASGFPSSNGHIPFECATIAEVLGEHGWNTYIVGKWHLTAEDEMNMASRKAQWPVGRGFERFYGFLGAETNQWYPDLVYDNHPVEQPKSPEEGYHLTEDLTDKALERLRELIELWWALAGQYGTLPLENRGAVEILTTDRPQLTKPRNRYVYYPGIAEVPESVAPNIRNRSYTVGVEVTIDSPDARGVLFAQGSRFGGHALYIKNGQLKYVYNFVGDDVQVVESTEPLPAGRKVLSASFEHEGDTIPAEGTLTLHMGDKTVGQGRIKTQPGKFSIAGEGLNVGKDSGEPVTTDYPGQAPWPFTGGTIHRVAVDVSGQPFVDLAAEVRMAYMRD